jgi:hypothetical protein
MGVAEFFARSFWCFTTFQAAVLVPYYTLIPGARAKLFTGLLCGLSLLFALLFVPKSSVRATAPELIVSAVLLVLIVLSGMHSATPDDSLQRGFVMVAAGLGGFWCARILIITRATQIGFTWFSIALLILILSIAVAGYPDAGKIEAFLDDNPHPVASRIMLLSFAPLVLILQGGWGTAALGLGLLTFSYLLFYLTSLRSAVLIPIVLGVLTTFFGALRLKHMVAALIPLAVLVGCFWWSLPYTHQGKQYEPAYYRFESYPFSWHVAVKHPWLGNGLRAPREEYLEDYEIKYPYVSREEFAASVRRIVTSENMFLSMMADLGFPFAILYTGSLGVLLWRLVGMVRNRDPGIFIPPLALLLALAAGVLQFFVLDGLYHPQVGWFFHTLLGLIPLPASARNVAPFQRESRVRFPVESAEALREERGTAPD